MAVFPDRIVQKNSTDSVGGITGQVAAGGTSPIIGGELVVARENGSAKLITLDSQGTPVVVGTQAFGASQPPYILLNFEEDNTDTPYDYAAAQPFDTVNYKFGAQGYGPIPSLPSTPRPNPVLIQSEDSPALGTERWTLEFWIKADPSEWIDATQSFTNNNNPRSLLVLSRQNYLFGQGAFTVWLDAGTSDTPGGLGTDTSNATDQAFGSICFGLGGQFGTHGNPLVSTEGDIVSSRNTTVVDNDWHHVVFSHEGVGRYTCYIDGDLKQRRILQAPIDHNNPGTSGIAQPSGFVLNGTVNINDDMPFPGEEYFGFKGFMDSFALTAGVAKYMGQSTLNVPTAATDGTPFSTPVDSLSGLYDTDLDLNIADGDVLQYSATQGAWINNPAPAFNISGNSLGDIGNVALAADVLIQDEEVLAWDAASQEWQNKDLTLTMLGDTVAASPTNGDVLRYSDASLLWESTALNYSDLGSKPSNLSEFVNDITLSADLDELNDIDAPNPAQGDTLVYNSTSQKWENQAAPPASLSANSISDIGDVKSFAQVALDPALSATDDLVLAWDVSAQSWRPHRLDVSDVENAADRVSDLVKDVNVSYWTNDSGYLTGTTVGSRSIEVFNDITITNVQESQVLVYRSGVWKNEYGPPANISTNSIGDLVDTTYYRPFSHVTGELTIEGMGMLHWDDPGQPTNIRFNLHYRSADQALGMEAIRTTDETGSSIHVSRGGGVDMRSDVNFFRLRGKPSVVTNRPQLRWETGDSFASPSTGDYIAIEMPATVSESVIYYLPEGDGDVGDVLATNGSGELSWVARTANNNIGALSDVDLATQLPIQGSALVYNATAGFWVPGSPAADVSSTSINGLLDVDTSTSAPTNGQGLGWNSTEGKWTPQDVAADLSSESIDALSDVDTTTAAPTTGQGLVWNGTKWAPTDVAADLTSESIDELSDVDTTTAAPAVGQGLVWNGSSWAPGDVSDVDLAAESIDELSDVDTTSAAPVAGQALVWDGSNWIPGNVVSTGVSGSAISQRASEDQTSDVNGHATFVDLGTSGTLVSIEADSSAWVTLYATTAARTADVNRPLSTDPAQGSGILAEFLLSANSPVMASPSTNYFNGNALAAEELYVAVRSQAGLAIDAASVTITAYAISGYTAVSGGTFGSG